MGGSAGVLIGGGVLVDEGAEVGTVAVVVVVDGSGSTCRSSRCRHEEEMTETITITKHAASRFVALTFPVVPARAARRCGPPGPLGHGRSVPHLSDNGGGVAETRHQKQLPSGPPSCAEGCPAFTCHVVSFDSKGWIPANTTSQKPVAQRARVVCGTASTSRAAHRDRWRQRQIEDNLSDVVESCKQTTAVQLRPL